MAMVRNFIRCERGATAIEYGLITAMVGLGLILSLTNLRTNFGNLMNSANNGLAGR
jgi:pilus assembly protein Flp/PilA